MTTVYLESVNPAWIRGSAEEQKRADEVLRRNWNTLKLHAIQAQTQESETPLVADTPVPIADMLDSEQLGRFDP